MRILILGAGAVGGYIGGRLIESGADVTFLVREEKRNVIEENGLNIYSQLGNLCLTPKCITSKELLPGFNVVILACKSYALMQAVNDIQKVADKETNILPLLNGVSHLKLLDDVFTREAVMGGLVHLALEQDGTGNIQHLNQFHRIQFGIRHFDQEAISRSFLDQLSKTKLEYKFSTHIQHDMWQKYIFLAALAGATCIFRGSVGEIMKTESGREFILELFHECVDIAKAYRNRPDENTMKKYTELLTDINSDYTASMLRDIQSGRQTEVNEIFGELVKLGTEKNLSTKLLGYALSHLQVYEAKRNDLKHASLDISK